MNAYHQNTKHSYYSVRSNPNRLNWDDQPSHFKSYDKTFLKYELDLEKKEHQLIYFTCGITAKKTYPGVEYYLRVNPSAGALYPNELYFQSRNNSHIKDGIYHYDNGTNSITLLKEINEDGLEPYFNQSKQVDGFIFLVSSVYYRSSWKYKDRAFRYCLLDCGHILGSIEASTYFHDKEYEIKYDFDKAALNKSFGFNNEEFFTAAVIVGSDTIRDCSLSELNFPYVNATHFFEENSLIEQEYLNTLNIENAILETTQPSFMYQKEHFEETILKRRSIREFHKESILKDEFLKIMDVLNQPIPSDCDERVEIYCVINRVKEMHLGVYKDGKYLQHGDFKQKAGYLCLEQILGMDSAVTFFLTTKSKNYQEAYTKAGVIGHRLYLSSNYLGYGCTGIGAYYDDEVSEFLEDDSMVLYALAIGN